MAIPLKIYPGITQIANDFKGILLDASGVFWGGKEIGLLPGSMEVMEKLVNAGKIVGILTNSTQLTLKEIDKLKQNGLLQGQHFHFLITSGEAVRQFLLQETLPFETPRNNFWLFGSTHPKFPTHEAIFQNTRFRETLDITQADFIYPSIPHINGQDQVDPLLFREKLEAIKDSKLPMICPNPDLFAPEGNPQRFVVRQGSIAKLYEDMGGKVYYFGKPYDTVFAIAMRCFSQSQITNPQDILMVGDSPRTDIRGAKNSNMQSALVTETGVMADIIAQVGDREKAVAELLPSDSPTYFIRRFINDL